MKALVGTFNQEKALLEAFIVIVKLPSPVCSTDPRHKRSIGVFWLHFSGAPQQTADSTLHIMCEGARKNCLIASLHFKPHTPR